MKRLRLIIIVFAAMFLFLSSQSIAEQQKSATYIDFYHSLSPHGSWVEINGGLVVWRPRTYSVNWRPYSEGAWIYTDQGWYWDSYEPYGSVVYHYGRWHFDDYQGWIWIPGYEWAPAWVEWRYDDVYVGWAPLSPYATFSVNFGIQYSRTYVVHHSHWHFVRYNNFCNPHVYNYYVSSRYNHNIYNSTRSHTQYKWRNNSVYNNGIDRRLVEQRGNTRVRQRNLEFNRGNNYRNDVRGDRIEVYRPENTRTFTENSRDLNIERGNTRSSLVTDDVKIGRDRNMKNGKVDINEDRNTNRDLNSRNTNERNTKLNDRNNKTTNERNTKLNDRNNKTTNERNTKLNDRNNKTTNERNTNIRDNNNTRKKTTLKENKKRNTETNSRNNDNRYKKETTKRNDNTYKRKNYEENQYNWNDSHSNNNKTNTRTEKRKNKDSYNRNNSWETKKKTNTYKRNNEKKNTNSWNTNKNKNTYKKKTNTRSWDKKKTDTRNKKSYNNTKRNTNTKKTYKKKNTTRKNTESRNNRNTTNRKSNTRNRR